MDNKIVELKIRDAIESLFQLDQTEQVAVLAKVFGINYADIYEALTRYHARKERNANERRLRSGTTN